MYDRKRLQHAIIFGSELTICSEIVLAGVSYLLGIFH